MREEERPHIHVHSADGEAKFWLEPEIKLARNHRISTVKLKEIERIIEAHYDELITAWNNIFRSGDN